MGERVPIARAALRRCISRIEREEPANAGIVASLLSVGVPNRPIDALLRNYLWVFPCAAMLACVFLLRQFFV